MPNGLTDLLIPPTVIPEAQAEPPLDGSDFVPFGGKQGTVGGDPVYYHSDQPDPVLAELRAAYEKQQGVQPAEPPRPSMAGMSLAHAAAPLPEQPVQSPQAVPVAAPSAQPGPAPLGTLEQQVNADLEAQRQLEVQAARDEAAAEKLAAVQRAGQADRRREELESVEMERQKVVGEQQAKVRGIVDEARNTKIDPTRALRNQNLFGKITGLFAVFLGGTLRSTTPGGRNPAMDSIDKWVEQDIAAQEAHLDNLNRSVGHERTILSDLREELQDKATARATLHTVVLEKISQDFNARLAGIKDARALARGFELKAVIDQRLVDSAKAALDAAAAAAQQKFENQHKKNVLAAENQRSKDDRESRERIASEEQATIRSNNGLDFLAEMTKSGAAALEARRAASANGGAGEINTNTVLGIQMDGEAPDSKTDRITFKDGTNPTAVGEVRKIVSTAHNVSDLVADIMELGTNKNLLPDQRKAMANSAMAGVRLTKVALIRGAASDNDQKLVDKAAAITDPQAFLTWLDEGENRNVLQYLADSTLRESNTQLRPYGVRLAPRAARPLTGDSKPTERNPATKTADARAASTDFKPGRPDRVGDRAFAPSAKMDEYLNISKSTSASYRTQGEMKTQRKDVATDVAALDKAMKKAAPGSDEFAELAAARSAAFTAMMRLDDLLQYQTEGSKINKNAPKLGGVKTAPVRGVLDE